MKLTLRIDGRLKTFEGDQEYIDKVMVEYGLKEKPKKKKKYKAVEEEKPSYEDVEKQELDEYLNEKQDGEA